MLQLRSASILAVLILLFMVDIYKCDCNGKEISNVCAVLYDDADCNEGPLGAPLQLKQGRLDLTTSSHNGAAKSVMVNHKCTFRGYVTDLETAGIVEVAGSKTNKKTEETIDRKGEFVVVAASETESKWENLDQSMLKKPILSVSCKCGNKGSCPVVPAHLCAIAYDNVGCDKGEFRQPLEIPVTDKLNLGFVRTFNYNGKIESVSIRKGCNFKGYKDPNLGLERGELDVNVLTADLHLDLTAENDFANSISSLSCTCA